MGCLPPTLSLGVLEGVLSLVQEQHAENDLRFLCAQISLGEGLITAGAQLVELDLSDNAFGPDGVRGFEALLKSPTCFTLRELKLNNCGMGIGGGKVGASLRLESRLFVVVSSMLVLKGERPPRQHLKLREKTRVGCQATIPVSWVGLAT